MISATRIIASFAAVFLLTACGLKGPLYLPPPEAAETQPAKSVPQKQDQPKNAPASKDDAQSEAAKQKASAKPSAPSGNQPSLEEPPSAK